MDVKIVKDGIMIVPETEFEEEFLCANFGRGYTYKAWLKTGLTIADVQGLKITTEKVEK